MMTCKDTHTIGVPLTLFLCVACAGCATDEPPQAPAPSKTSTVRFATFNVSLNRAVEGGLAEDLAGGSNPRARQIASIIQRVRPDVLLLNEFDYDVQGINRQRFLEEYLAVGQHGQQGIDYPFHFAAEVNTGVLSGFDWNKDGREDAFGFGKFPGQYGMLVLSRYPIQHENVRTFQRFLWKDMPDALLPVDPATGEPYYTAEQLQVFRLSSKSHWDVPIKIDDCVVHFLVCHPTPPVFDGPEDRNGRRNHDEIRLFADYIDPRRSGYIYDDDGRKGGLADGSYFVIAGDLNADPHDGDSVDGAAMRLTEHVLVNATTVPASQGGIEQSRLQGGVNQQHRSDPAHDTADFPDKRVGNYRVDYVLPSLTFTVAGGGVFWPTSQEDGFSWVTASDHRLVWVDLK